MQHKIAILGGSGFVGQHLCNALAHSSSEILVLTRNSTENRNLTILPNVQLVEVDIFNPDALSNALYGCDVVINLVGILNATSHYSFQKVHVELVKSLIQACKQQKVQRLLHISALNANPEAPSEYLRSKGRAEQLLQQANDLHLHTTIFAPSVMFGSHDHFFTSFAKLLKLSPGIMLLPCADATFAPVFVEDIVHAMIKSIDDKQTYAEKYSLCGPETYTLKQLVQLTAKIINKKCLIMGMSPALSNFFAHFLQYFPGKPLTPDNYLSSRLPSVCKMPFPALFNIQATRIKNVLPHYIGKNALSDSYAIFRKELPPRE